MSLHEHVLRVSKSLHPAAQASISVHMKSSENHKQGSGHCHNYNICIRNLKLYLSISLSFQLVLSQNHNSKQPPNTKHSWSYLSIFYVLTYLLHKIYLSIFISLLLPSIWQTQETYTSSSSSFCSHQCIFRFEV